MAATTAEIQTLRLFLLFLIHTTFSLQTTSTTTKAAGFTTNLIHRDSLLSPFHNISDRWNSAYRRSISRRKFFTSPAGFQSPLSPAAGQYLMKVSIGTPPLDVMLSVDTGSQLIWTQCLPCTHCHPQRYPLFDPSKSSSYQNMACPSQPCDDLPKHQCFDNKCVYSYRYGDNSYTTGYLAVETFAVATSNGTKFSLPDITFGCGDDNRGIFSADEAGTVGLSGGPLSLTSQLGIDMSWRFSHCFAADPASTSSQLVFGENALLAGNFTPIVVSANENGAVYYYLTLDDISVGSERLNIPPGTFDRAADSTGGIIIDSGTPYTLLNSVGFDLLVGKLRNMISLEPVEGGSDAAGLCYKGTSKDLEEGKVPVLTFHFSGLDASLRPLNYFAEEAEGIVCLAMVSTNGFSIFGSIAQQNKNVGYDLEAQRVYVLDTSC